MRELFAGVLFEEFLHGCTYLPKKICAAEELSLPTETLIGERGVTVEAPDTVRVPRPLQDVQQELVQDRLVAARAGNQHSCCWLAPP